MMLEAIPSFWRRTTALIVLAIVALATVLFVATGTGSAGQPPPGLTAGVSAVDDLPAEANVPSAVVETLRAFDPALIGSVDQARKKMRKLRSGLGASQTAIYAFRSQTKSVCVIVVDHSAICPSSLQAGQAGLLFAIGGGYGTADSPGMLAGVAADNVTGLDLIVDGADVPVTVENNAVFAELPFPASRAEITVHYRGYDDQTYSVNLGA